MDIRRDRLLLGALAAGGAYTLVTTFTPSLRFAYRSPSLHLVVETAAGLVALLAAYLVAGRLREGPRLDDLLLAYSLALCGGGSLFLAAIPVAAESEMLDRFSTWAPFGARLLGAAALALAAFAPGRPLRSRVSLTLLSWLAAAVTLAAIAALTALLTGRLPLPVPPGLDPRSSYVPHVVGPTGVLVGQLASVVFFALASVGFARRSRQGDELLAWFAAGSVLAALASVHYLLFPSLYSEWLYTGDFLRLGFFVLLLTGAAREIHSFWHAREEAAVLVERHRIARDLHDGLAQELAYIAVEGRSLGRERSSPKLLELAASADRALGEARRAIAALSEPLDQPVALLLAQAAEEVTSRSGLRLTLILAEDVDVPPTAREDLVRIVREAVTNAARHSGGESVAVQLADGSDVRVRIIDGGAGFDPDTVSEGFGLASMRARAEALGGALRIRSAPGRGTEVEVVLPSSRFAS